MLGIAFGLVFISKLRTIESAFNTMKKIFLFALALSSLVACQKDDAATPDLKTPFSEGLLILNEGAFGSGTGTIQFYNLTNKSISNDLFFSMNNRPLGNIAQSIIRVGSEYWISVNNAEKVEVTDASLKSVATIGGLNLPDQFCFPGGNQVYVSEWKSFASAGHVVVINRNNKSVVKRIPVGELPSKMLYTENQLLVVNSGDSTISIINTSADTLVRTIAVGDRPNGLVRDAAGKVWVLCGGKLSFTGQETQGSLVRLNNGFTGVDFQYSFPQVTDHPENLVLSPTGDGLMFSLNGAIYSMAVSASAPVNTNVRANVYKMQVDKVRNRLYVTDAGNFSSPGKVFLYSLPGLSLVDSVNAGVIPREVLGE